MLDRIDLHVEMPLMDFRELSSNAATGEKSETIRQRVVYARRTQSERFRQSANPPIRQSAKATNSAMSPRQMKVHCQVDAEGTATRPESSDGGMTLLAEQNPQIEKRASEVPPEFSTRAFFRTSRLCLLRLDFPPEIKVEV